ncbi:MAG: RNA polymerase sigma-54 factor, partial [Alphaproteobacteria bacterium]
MALGPRLDLRQGQQLVMTPQLQQAIKLLQLNNLELAAYVAEELERNPLLESEDAEAPAPDEPDGAPASEEEEAGGTGSDGSEWETTADKALDRDPVRDGADDPLDADFSDNVFNHDSACDSTPAPDAQLGLNGSGAISGIGNGDSGAINENLAGETSLHEH